MFLQKTIQSSTQVHGVGLHTGRLVCVTFRPAPANTGIYLIRTDLARRPSILSHVECVQSTLNATTLGRGSASVSTVEHCLSVLTALRIDNLLIEVDGPEMPAMDGSANTFLKALREAGLVEQDHPKKYAYVNQVIYYSDKDKYAYVTPYNGLRITCTIDFPHPQIGRQTLDIDISEDTFDTDLSQARTFGFLRDVEYLRRQGLARGSDLSNTVVLDDRQPLNPEGLRFADEFVRHKVLDALGDLATLGAHLMGHIVLYRSGHSLMHHLILKILEFPRHYRYVELGKQPSEEERKTLAPLV